MIEDITAEDVHTLLCYDHETGSLRWKTRNAVWFSDGVHTKQHTCNRWNAKWAGKRAGYVTPLGYVEVNILGRTYQAHRLAWLLITGAWPEHDIDHKDGSPSNNRAANLRLATHAQNMRNSKKRSDNTSGYKGVSWSKPAGKWRASIQVDKKALHLGLFNTPESAHRAYEAAARAYHGEFANSGGGSADLFG